MSLTLAAVGHDCGFKKTEHERSCGGCFDLSSRTTINRAKSAYTDSKKWNGGSLDRHVTQGVSGMKETIRDARPDDRRTQCLVDALLLQEKQRK